MRPEAPKPASHCWVRASSASSACIFWVPALAQLTLMQRVLEGETLGAADLLLPLAVAAALSALCVVFVARQLRAAALR